MRGIRDRMSNLSDLRAFQIAAGVDVTVGGVHVGQLFQTQHGLSRKNRVIRSIALLCTSRLGLGTTSC